MTKTVNFVPLDLQYGLAEREASSEQASIEGLHPATQSRVTNNNTEPMTVAAVATQTCPSSYDIVQQGKIYHISLDLDLFEPDFNDDRAFLIWLYQRSPDETLYITPSNSYPPPNFCLWIDYICSLFEAIMRCPAKTIAVIDGPMMSLDAYVAMACQAIHLGPFAFITIQPAWTGVGGGVASDEEARRALAVVLYRRAVDLQLLTEDEVDILLDSRPVTLTVAQFETASYEHLLLTKE